MASVEGVEARVREATTAGFRGQLLARGEARSKIWKDGRLPAGAPNFSTTLTHDLLSYGYTLLSDGLNLLERGGAAGVAKEAFEGAARAIEAVIHNGRPDRPEAGFHRFVAASAYHLAQYSACAFSLLNGRLQEANLSSIERALSLLMIRDLDRLDELIYTYKASGRGADEEIAERVAAAFVVMDADELGGELESDGALADALMVALEDVFFSALAEAMLGFEQGEGSLIEGAQRQFDIGAEVAGEAGMVPCWWACRLARFLIGDLWRASFHAQLPPDGLHGKLSSKWQDLRDLFIASLLKRSRSEIELWPSQINAAARALDLDDNMVVSLPTSAGKTRIAELAILSCLSVAWRDYGHKRL